MGMAETDCWDTLRKYCGDIVMMYVITAQNSDEHADLLEEIWRFRHRQFVERLGWRELARPDGRETDRFDTDDAIHLVVTGDNRVVGYSRLLRTSRPHLLSDIYPDIMDGGMWPRAHDVYEWTRCIADEDARPLGGIRASHLLITGVLEFCLLSGITGMIVETHPKLVAWMQETGYRVQTLNRPHIINGTPVVPVYIGATQVALDRHRQLFGITGSVLAIDDDLINPVAGYGRLFRASASPAAAAGSGSLPDIDFGAMRDANSDRCR
jgi:acyl-homoserine lactone synthase